MVQAPQEKFVAAIESAAQAMLSERTPKGVTPREVCEFAGWYLEYLRGVCTSLLKARDLTRLKRLEAAFLRFEGIGLPVPLTSAIHALEGENMSEELKLEAKIPTAQEKAGRSVEKTTHPESHIDIKLQGEVAIMLRPLPKQTQLRIIQSVQTMNGLDE